jgi:hypothetical protein
MIYNPKESLKNIVDNGIIIDFLAAEEAIALYKTIGNHQSALVNNDFAHLFGVLQIVLAKEIVLCLIKIYENNDKYPLRSFPCAIKLIQENCNQLKIEYREQLEDKLTTWGLEKKCLITMTDSELTTVVCNVLKDKIPSPSAMKAIKNIRDKRLAHSELIDETEILPIIWQQIDDLIALAKTLLGVIGNSYLGSLYEINEEYSLSYDASIASHSLIRLLKQASIVS